jgi:hypothetical protein
MAAAIVSKNRKLFGFAESTSSELKKEEILASDGSVVKVVEQENPTDELEEPVAEIENEYLPDENDPSIPTETFASFVEQPKIWNDGSPKARAILVPTVNKAGRLSGSEIAEFEVQSPADLLKVAKAAGLSYPTVKALNPEVLRWCTPPHLKTYRLKLPAKVKERFLNVYNHEAFPRKVDFLAHKVKDGDTVERIARRFGINPEPVSELNGLSRRRSLRSGDKVLLPMPSDRTRSVASLDLLESLHGTRRKKKEQRARPPSRRISMEERMKARSSRRSRQ